MVKGQSGWLKGLVEGAKLMVAGRDFLNDGAFGLHVVISGNCQAAVESDLAAIRDVAMKLGGEEIPNSIPKAVRADPFKPLISILGPDGDRWAELNAKVAHFDALALIRDVDALIARYEEKMKPFGMYTRRLMIAIGQHSFSYEPIVHWFDQWNPVHKLTPEPSHLKTLKEPPPNPEAASNQIGKSYPYFESLRPETARIIGEIKAMLDPDKLMNPETLGFK